LLLWFRFHGRWRRSHRVDLVAHATERSLVCLLIVKQVFEIHVESWSWSSLPLLGEMIVRSSRWISLHLSIRSCISTGC
jgi:hypothetical protein